MADLQPGDLFTVKGYDLVAQARYASGFGEVLVLNNNSTHYLVAVRRGDADDDAEFERSFSYELDDPPLEGDDEDELAAVARYAYLEALRLMLKVAVGR